MRTGGTPIWSTPSSPVKSHRVAAENHEVGAGIRQGEEQIAKVVGKLDHGERRGTNLQGISGGQTHREKRRFFEVFEFTACQRML